MAWCAPRKPVVLTRGEIQALLSDLAGSKRMMAMLLYGAGLRLMECCRLRVKDVDFSQIRSLCVQGRATRIATRCFPQCQRVDHQTPRSRPAAGQIGGQPGGNCRNEKS